MTETKDEVMTENESSGNIKSMHIMRLNFNLLNSYKIHNSACFNDVWSSLCCQRRRVFLFRNVFLTMTLLCNICVRCSVHSLELTHMLIDNVEKTLTVDIIVAFFRRYLGIWVRASVFPTTDKQRLTRAMLRTKDMQELLRRKSFVDERNQFVISTLGRQS